MKRALVFCGGGAKGSYEAGVWKYLEEIGLKFDIVTGTSIGGLNAAMYAQHDYDRDIELWNKVTIDQILEDSFKYDENKSIKVSLKEKDNLFRFLKNYISNGGGNVSPFKELIDEYISPKKIISSDITVGIVTAKFPTAQGVEVVLNNLTPAKIKKYLLATASAFPVFQICKIDGESYIDGGYYDNLPINFALDLGADEIVAVDLSPNITHKEFLNKEFVKYIYPTWNLGGFLKFERNSIDQNWNLGYLDAKKAYGEYIGFKYTFNKDVNINARNFMLTIAKVLGYMKKNKVKTIIKPEADGNVYKILEEFTYRPLTDQEYYIRALEITAEFFEIDYVKVYDIDVLFDMIQIQISELEYDPDIFDDYLRLKSINKQKDFVSKIDDKKLLCHLCGKTISYSIDDLAIICAVKPRIFVMYLAMKMRG